MATLYVRDVPEELYAALRERAGAEGRSISAEAVYLLEQAIEQERSDRQRAVIHARALDRMRRMRLSTTLPARYPNSTELLREDRAR